MRITSFGLKSLRKGVGSLAKKSKSFISPAPCLPHIPDDLFDDLILEIEIMLGTKSGLERYFWEPKHE